MLTLAAISDAYYCTECTRLEKDRDGCPRIINVGLLDASCFGHADRWLRWERVGWMRSMSGRNWGESVADLTQGILTAPMSRLEKGGGFKRG